jgi:hypothetical protein
VEDDEDAHQKSGGNDGKRERDPLGNVQHPDHETPDGQVRHQAVGELRGAAAQNRLSMPGHGLFPGR